MINDITVGVTSVSFSKNNKLISEIRSKGFGRVLLNEAGTRFTSEELVVFLSQCDIAIVGLDKIDESLLKQVPSLKAVVKYGVGLDNIDFSACEKYGVSVLHTQGVNKRSVAEMVLGNMLSLCRNIYVSSNEHKAYNWVKNGGVQLSGKTVGVIGVGHIGKEVISLLKPFSCNILVNDIIDQSDYYIENDLKETSKESIYSEADFITVHTPLNDSTVNMIDKTAIGMMKNSAFIINTARGGIVNENDLKVALTKGMIAGAAVDVYLPEPPTDNDFISIPNLICTPHIGGNALEAVEAMGEAAIINTMEYVININN